MHSHPFLPKRIRQSHPSFVPFVTPSLQFHSNIQCILLSSLTFFFHHLFVQESLGELGFGDSPSSGQTFKLYEHLQIYLHIAYQQGSHINNGDQTHDVVSYESTPYQPG